MVAGNGHLSPSQRQGRKPPSQGRRLCRRFGSCVQDYKSLDMHLIWGWMERAMRSNGLKVWSWRIKRKKIGRHMHRKEVKMAWGGQCEVGGVISFIPYVLSYALPIWLWIWIWDMIMDRKRWFRSWDVMTPVSLFPMASFNGNQCHVYLSWAS